MGADEDSVAPIACDGDRAVPKHENTVQKSNSMLLVIVHGQRAACPVDLNHRATDDKDAMVLVVVKVDRRPAEAGGSRGKKDPETALAIVRQVNGAVEEKTGVVEHNNPPLAIASESGI